MEEPQAGVRTNTRDFERKDRTFLYGLKTTEDLQALEHNQELYANFQELLLSNLPVDYRCTRKEYESLEPEQRKQYDEQLYILVGRINYGIELTPDQFMTKGVKVFTPLEVARLKHTTSNVDRIRRLYEETFTFDESVQLTDNAKAVYDMYKNAADYPLSLLLFVKAPEYGEGDITGHHITERQMWLNKYTNDNGERFFAMKDQELSEDDKRELRESMGLSIDLKGKTVYQVMSEIYSDFQGKNVSQAIEIDTAHTENEKRRQLLAQIDVRTHVRNPDIDFSHISVNYLENIIDYEEFLTDCLFENGKLSISKIRQITESETQFLSWLLECHRIMSSGKFGDNPYYGTSEASFTEKNVGRLRTQEDYVLGQIPRHFVINIAEMAKKYDDPFHDVWEHRWKPRDSSLDDVHISIPLKDNDTQGILPTSVFTSTRSYTQYPAAILNDPHLYYRGDAYHYFPSPEALPRYIAEMRTQFMELADAIEENDTKKAVQSLALWYRAGIKGQITQGVLNSVLMTQVNRIMDGLGYEPIPHGYIDLHAWFFTENSFMNYFADQYTKKPVIEAPNLSPWDAFIQKFGFGKQKITRSA